MTFEEKLGFEVAKELLDIHNKELQEAHKKFSGVFQKIWDEALEKGIRLFDLESAFDDFLDVVKEEYYKAGKRIDSIVQSETLKNEIAKATT